MNVAKRFVHVVLCSSLLLAFAQVQFAQAQFAQPQTAPQTVSPETRSAVDIFVGAFNMGDKATLKALYPRATGDTLPFATALGNVQIDPDSVSVAETVSGSALVRFDYLSEAGARTPGTLTVERLQDGRPVVWELGPELASLAAPATGWSSWSPWLRRAFIILSIPVFLSLLFVVGAFLYGLVQGVVSPSDARPDPKIRYVNKREFEPSVLNWLLSVVAIYKVMWVNVIDRLLDDEDIEQTFNKREVLQNDWGVYNRQDLLSALMDLYHEGHRPSIRQVQAENPVYPQADPLAWDLVRYLMLCAVGASIKYIEPEEAHMLMLPAGKALQASYESWADMADGFLTGRAVWLGRQGGGEKSESEIVMEKTVKLLKTDAKSPWQRVPWTFPLPEANTETFFTRVSESYLSYYAHRDEQDDPLPTTPEERTVN